MIIEIIDTINDNTIHIIERVYNLLAIFHVINLHISNNAVKIDIT
jgi:hypothetical protein